MIIIIIVIIGLFYLKEDLIKSVNLFIHIQNLKNITGFTLILSESNAYHFYSLTMLL